MHRYLCIFLYRYALPVPFCQNIIFFIVLVLLSKINWANMSIHDSVPLLHKFLCACVLSPFSHLWLFVTPWTVACQAPCPWRFSRQEYWSGLPWSLPADLPDSGFEPSSLMWSAGAGGFFTTSATWEAPNHSVFIIIFLQHLLVWNLQKNFFFAFGSSLHFPYKYQK